MRHSNIISKISAVMRTLFPEACTILYGSQARNEAHESSDIDLLILLPDSYTGQKFVNRRSEIVDKLYDIEIDHGVRISPLVLIRKIWENRPSQFHNNVSQDGITI